MCAKKTTIILSIGGVDIRINNENINLLTVVLFH